MSTVTNPLFWLIGITAFLWGAAIWATVIESSPRERRVPPKAEDRDLAA
jgi:hypothetical protein